MKTIKHIILLALLCCSTVVGAQEQNIALTPVVLDGIDVPEKVRPALEQKLTQIVTSNGYGSLSYQFALTANVVVLEKTAVPTVPPQVNLTLEVSLYAVNTIDKVIVDELTLEVSSIERNEARAYTDAIKQIKPRSPQVRRFMTSVREKIVDYYAERVPVLIAKADAQAVAGNYDAAIQVLSVIPESVPEYPQVAQMMGDYVVKAYDDDAKRLIQAAKADFALGMVEAGLQKLVAVSPLSNYFDDASAVLNAMLEPMPEEEKEKEEVKEVVEQHQEQVKEAEVVKTDKVAFDKAALKASYERNESKNVTQSPDVKNSVSEKMSGWFFGKLK